ncbi:hypothetical protein, partial [Streptomyces sp. SM14]|uniref:hypothetical protein n=2 Tax=unclassified Streptomyces TaxID=2593676 RepID=UPI0015E15C19
AWAEGVSRLRSGARTEPGRLRIIGAILAGLLVLFGATTAWQITERTAAATTVLQESQPLSADAAGLYRSLADANTTAAAGFLSGGEEPREVRGRYEEDIRRAADLLSTAASHSSGSPEAREAITLLSERLPVYTGLVETARANNRQGYPIGGAYLRHADRQMQDVLLPAAERLYELERARFRSDLDEARAWPWVALGSGVLALGALGWAQRRLYRRTNRVLNGGMVAATVAGGVLLVWLAGAHAVSGASMSTANDTGARSLHVLNEAWTEALKARGDENLMLVARGAGAAFADSYQARMAEIAGTEEEPGGLLRRAEDEADDAQGREPVREAVEHTGQWRERHRLARESELSGDYESAVRQVTGATDSTGQFFDRVDSALARAVAHEQRQFEEAAGRGRSQLSGLVFGSGALALVAAGAAVLGIGRRLSEYR